MSRYILKSDYEASTMSTSYPFKKIYKTFKKGFAVQGEVSSDGKHIYTFDDGTYGVSYGRPYYKIPLSYLTVVTDVVANTNTNSGIENDLDEKKSKNEKIIKTASISVAILIVGFIGYKIFKFFK